MQLAYWAVSCIEAEIKNPVLSIGSFSVTQDAGLK